MKHDSYKLFLDHIQGLIVIDLEEKVVFLSEQCGKYINVAPEESIGRHIYEVFPPSKMPDVLRYNLPEVTDLYFAEGRVSGSKMFPVKENGRVVGVMEIDLFQDFGAMKEFVQNYLHLEDDIKHYKDEMSSFRNIKYTVDTIIGNSEPIKELKKQIYASSQTNSTVLITGETGTGKELVAHAIHNLSRRRFRNFISINGAALPETLAESELFGYEGGAFTGADRRGRKGKFELADKGTLFIDEINNMPAFLQPKLLRVIQEKEVDRIGGSDSVFVDVRLIAAANQELLEMVKRGKFREDLYYRLNVMHIKTPPLREHKEDIPLLVEKYVGYFNQLMGKNIRSVDEKVYRALLKHEWPGNVRELNNVVERAMNYAEGDMLTLKQFELESEPDSYGFCGKYENLNPIEKVKQEAEKKLIIQTLKAFGGNKTLAAKHLNISRPLLYQKMNRLQISKDIV